VLWGAHRPLIGARNTCDDRYETCAKGMNTLSGALIIIFRANYEFVSLSHCAIFAAISQKNAIILRINYGQKGSTIRI